MLAQEKVSRNELPPLNPNNLSHDRLLCIGPVRSTPANNLLAMASCMFC